MMKNKIFVLGQVFFCSRFHRRFHQWYHFKGNVMVSIIELILFCRPIIFYTMTVYIGACIKTSFLAGAIIRHMVIKPVLCHLWVKGQGRRNRSGQSGYGLTTFGKFARELSHVNYHHVISI